MDTTLGWEIDLETIASISDSARLQPFLRRIGLCLTRGAPGEQTDH
jgi:hypothetical protein